MGRDKKGYGTGGFTVRKEEFVRTPEAKKEVDYSVEEEKDVKEFKGRDLREEEITKLKAEIAALKARIEELEAQVAFHYDQLPRSARTDTPGR